MIDVNAREMFFASISYRALSNLLAGRGSVAQQRLKNHEQQQQEERYRGNRVERDCVSSSALSISETLQSSDAMDLEDGEEGEKDPQATATQFESSNVITTQRRQRQYIADCSTLRRAVVEAVNAARFKKLHVGEHHALSSAVAAATAMAATDASKKANRAKKKTKSSSSSSSGGGGGGGNAMVAVADGAKGTATAPSKAPTKLQRKSVASVSRSGSLKPVGSAPSAAVAGGAGGGGKAEGGRRSPPPPAASVSFIPKKDRSSKATSQGPRDARARSKSRSNSPPPPSMRRPASHASKGGNSSAKVATTRGMNNSGGGAGGVGGKKAARRVPTTKANSTTR
jgi:hypothetical protein